MRLFPDASVVLAACGRAAGASHAIFDFAGVQGWRLLTGDYVLREVALSSPLSAALTLAGNCGSIPP